MKTTFLFPVFAFLLLISCSKNANDETEQATLLEQPELQHLECGFVDQYWSNNAYLNNFIINNSQTNFIYNQNDNIRSVLGVPRVPLSIVHDDVNPNATYNAISYSSGKIYFGEAIYIDALNTGQIVPAMILAHEYGHQIQYRFNGIPSVNENTARAIELEADGFAGYYMRNSNGYNASWAQAGPGFEFSYQIGDNNTNSPNHHGTPRQRRSATRLGWYLGAYNLSPQNFDYYFFYYYQNYVLPGNLFNVPSMSEVMYDEDIHTYILSKIDELRKINSGEINAEEFTRLE